jgi:hypothetical protein
MEILNGIGRYKGVNSQEVDKHLFDIIASDLEFLTLQIEYTASSKEQYPRLRVTIIKNDDENFFKTGIIIIPSPGSHHVFLPGSHHVFLPIGSQYAYPIRNFSVNWRDLDVMNHNGSFIVRNVKEFKVHLANAKKWFRKQTGKTIRYVVGLEEIESSEHQSGVQQKLDRKHQMNIAKANAFHREKVVREIQKKFLKAYYDPGHPVGQRRLLREFSALTM